MIKKAAFLGSAILMATVATPAMAQFKTALDVSKSTVQEAKVSQQRIDALDDAANKALVDFRANNKQLELLTRFNKTRAKEVENQAKAIERLKSDIENVGNIQKGLLPLMDDMVAKLELFVAADMPFLAEERQNRLDRLRGKMSEPGVDESQKYRLIQEAYQIENEYGRTMEAYPGVQGELTGDFLKVGRIALIFKTPDNSVLQRYDSATGQFVDLDKSFLDGVKYAMKMANEQTAPDLLTIPVPAPINVAQ